MIKRFVKYIPSNNWGFYGNVDYVYFNSKKWYAVKRDGKKEDVDAAHAKACVSAGLWVEAGPVVRKGWKYYKGQINPRKNYLFVEPDYIWFADGARVIKDKLYKGYTIKTKNELDNECYVGKGKFLVEID